MAMCLRPMGTLADLLAHNPGCRRFGIRRSRGAAGDVVGEVPDVEGGAAEVFQSADQRFGGHTRRAGPVEVGQHVGGPLLERAPECDDLAQAAGDPLLTM